MTGKSFLDNNDIADNYKRIVENIENAGLKAGRTDKVRVMAVTKTVSAERVNRAIALGIDLIGENRVQEFLQKHADYSGNCEIHFIGSLQSNKVKYIIDKVSLIHSVDSVRLAEEINRRARSIGLVKDILLEVNIAGEESKSGAAPEALPALLEEASVLENVRVRGLMTIPPPDFTGSNEHYFDKTRRLFDDLKAKAGKDFDILSMGMSDDYETAVVYGSNIVRIGTALFGYR